MTEQQRECLTPDCSRLVSPSVAFCCNQCGLRGEGHGDIEGHSVTCGSLTPREERLRAALHAAADEVPGLSDEELRARLDSILARARAAEAAAPDTGPVPRLEGDNIVMNWHHKGPAR